MSYNMMTYEQLRIIYQSPTITLSSLVGVLKYNFEILLHIQIILSGVLQL